MEISSVVTVDGGEKNMKYLRMICKNLFIQVHSMYTGFTNPFMNPLLERSLSDIKFVAKTK